jgi:uncharacterized membrane protein
MGPVGLIAFWAALFLTGHFALSSAPVRGRLTGALGEQPFRGVYSVVALGTFIPLIVVFAHHKHGGPLLWNLRGVTPVRWLVWLLMLAALVMWVASFITPNPGTIGAPDRDLAPRGILKLTRHPNFVAFSIFGFAHILMNAWLGDIFFFGAFPVLGIVGGLHQDRRKLREMGEKYRRFLDQTSFMPGVALLSGQQHYHPQDVPWLAVGVGAALTVVLVVLHPWLFGGHPIS